MRLARLEQDRLAELTAVIKRGLETFYEVGNALLEIRDSRIYRQTHKTFEAYCREELGISKSHANRKIQAAILAPMGVKTEREGRRILEEQRRQERRALRAGAETKAKKRKRRCELYVCACRDLHDHVLAGSVDAIITDPPYRKAALTARNSLGVWGELSAFAAHALKDDGVLVTMCGQTYLNDIIARLNIWLDYWWTISFDTPGGTPYQTERGVSPQWKPVLVFSRRDRKPKLDPFSDKIKSESGARFEFHRWSQPEHGVTELVERFSLPGDLVVDPFVGGGTTAVVALDLHRDFVGADIDPQCVETTRERLTRATE